VQASSAWTAPSGTLGRLVAEARARALSLQARASELERLAESAVIAPSFIDALTRSEVAIVAEVKRRSPSKGWIRQGLSAPDQALAYHAGGAAAISVLTEPHHFGGSPEDLTAVLASVPIPALKKDFHVAPVQLIEARALGASAALLIARALSPDALAEMMKVASDLSLEVLVEVRDESELDRALSLGARVVGINNRDLETLEMDPRTSERLLARIPSSVVAIAESGVSSREDVERVARAGADAVLVGSSVSAAENPTAAVRSLAGVRKSKRAR
jgi:indole-3-glycerol phosphate synthase